MKFESGKDFGDEVDQGSSEILLPYEIETENEIGELLDEISGVFEIFWNRFRRDSPARTVDHFEAAPVVGVVFGELKSSDMSYLSYSSFLFNLSFLSYL